MKKILFILFASFPAIIAAQSLTPEVIASSGSTFTDGTSQLDWTLGEPATSSFTAGSDLLTQGFHQPQLLITTIDAIETISVSVFPNPTISNLNIQFTDAKAHCIAELYTAEGKLLISKAYTNTKEFQIEMATYTAGNYILYIKENNKKSSYKISKIN